MKWLYILTALLLFSCQKIDDIGVLVPPTVDQDPNLPSVSVNVAGRQRLIHVRTFGTTSNPTLFILHGSLSDTRPYRNICESLSEKYFVVIWDQRGCGLSERITEEEFTLETALEEINAMKIIYTPNNKVTILGHSWGGALATFYTSNFPENIEQLLLIEPMPLKDKDMQKIYTSLVDFTYNNSSWNNLARHGLAISPKDHAQIDYRSMMLLKSDMTAGYHCNPDNPPDWPIHRVGGYIDYVRNKQLGSLKGNNIYFSL
jgi:proline iminopeptidase